MMLVQRTTPRPRSFPAVLLGLGVLPMVCLAEPPAAAPAGVSAVPPPPAARRPAPRALVQPQAALPAAPEPDGATAGTAGPNPFAGKAVFPGATGQTLSAPVTVNANTSADALTVTQTGGGRAISGAVTGGSNPLSAMKGITSGSGSGVNGVNSGTGGQAGKFEITNAASTQPSLLVTTTGTGNGLQAIIKSTAYVDSPAVLGQHNARPGYGVGVKGEGGYIGVSGEITDGNFGYGVFGQASDGIGVEGDSSNGSGVSGFSTNGAGLNGFSNHNYGTYTYSTNSYGLYAGSSTSYAGYFAGPVYATGGITASSYGYTSDRDQKQDFAEIDSGDVLTRIAAMPVTAWDYKSRPAERHIGPMAQDFHAAFGLGADDKHIDVVDGIGVSLAAIKELQRQLVERDARIDRLESQLQARIVALEQAAATTAAGAIATAR